MKGRNRAEWSILSVTCPPSCEQPVVAPESCEYRITQVLPDAGDTTETLRLTCERHNAEVILGPRPNYVHVNLRARDRGECGCGHSLGVHLQSTWGPRTCTSSFTHQNTGETKACSCKIPRDVVKELSEHMRLRLLCSTQDGNDCRFKVFAFVFMGDENVAESLFDDEPDEGGYGYRASRPMLAIFCEMHETAQHIPLKSNEHDQGYWMPKKGLPQVFSRDWFTGHIPPFISAVCDRQPWINDETGRPACLCGLRELRFTEPEERE